MAAISPLPVLLRMKKPSEPEWYRRRSYLHFDSPIGVAKAAAYVENAQNVARHAFLPLVRYIIETEKVRRDPTTGTLGKHPKRRAIAYASHLDSHVFSYYASILAAKYEDILAADGLAECVLAFRPLGLNNIHFAKAAFDSIKARGPCAAIALDVNGFFDNLDHAILRKAWAATIEQSLLPPDHYAVFKAVTRYASVDREPLFSLLGISPNNPKADRFRICSAKALRDTVRSSGLIQTNVSGRGIPQGTPISALLSNIYMLDFDREVNALVTEMGGTYFRYCDDILAIVPRSSTTACKQNIFKALGRLNLEINPKKTEISRFSVQNGGLRASRPLQYLGFMFDGQQAVIRSAAFAKFSNRMKRGVRLAKLTARSRNSARARLGLASKALYKAKLFERYSHLGTRNFIRYGHLAADILDSPAIRRQLRPWWARLIAQMHVD